MTKKTNSKRSSFYSRMIKRSFSTSLVMAALATLAACDGSHINDEAHLKAAPSSSHASPQPGVVASKAKLISDEMLMAASNALAAASPLVNTGLGSLLPPLAAIAQISREIAFEVGKVAMEQGLALEMSDDALRDSIERNFWKAEYRPYKRVSI